MDKKNLKSPDRDDKKSPETQETNDQPKETGGPKGPEPTRYGDWEQGGRCTDF